MKQTNSSSIWIVPHSHSRPLALSSQISWLNFCPQNSCVSLQIRLSGKCTASKRLTSTSMEGTWRRSWGGTVLGCWQPLITTTCASARPWTTSRCTSRPQSTGRTSRTVRFVFIYRHLLQFALIWLISCDPNLCLVTEKMEVRFFERPIVVFLFDYMKLVLIGAFLFFKRITLLLNISNLIEM